ncbi:MAG: succinylglutamate desuccinylase/aspartoacylase family protein [Gammaproteobacteria bacterium]|nr:succinylglutamate desuccinylase/aspartoacylase family protein [Gammaproteobacteria bacterium]MCB1922170.1 succinylglutamate desuccinylase/aspartoacylase family protein [Gammaproteobacteria bacterium]
MAYRVRARVVLAALLHASLITPPTVAESALGDARLPDIAALCQEIGNKLGSVSVADCQRQQLQSTGYRSVLQRELAIKEYPPRPPKVPLGRVLVIGGIHGDEYSSVSVVFKWMEILDIHHSGLFHWHFVPLSNPDGLLREESQRQNERGVDLNRNFPSRDWDELAQDYWQQRTARDPRRYPGPHKASEPEVAYLVDEIASFKPDIIISLHAPYGLIDHDGPPKAPEYLGNLTLRRLGVFPGSLGNYGGVDLNVPVVTVELSHAGIMPSQSQVSRMWTDVVGWLVRELRAKRSASAG